MVAHWVMAQTPSIEFETRPKADMSMSVPAPTVDHKDLTAPVTGIQRHFVTAFRFHGVTQFRPEDLASELSSYRGRELSADDLRQAALAIAKRYLQQGSMARVRVAAVSLADGVADIAVQELRVGKLRVEVPPEARINPAWAERFILGDVRQGAPVPLVQLEGGVAHLNAQPGIAAAIALDPGVDPNEVDITVRLTERPIVSGRVSLDNHGLREIGQERFGIALRGSNALGGMERLSIDLEQTAGSYLIAPSLSVPLPDPDLRANLETIQAHYQARRIGNAMELKGEFSRWKISLNQSLKASAGATLDADYGLTRTAYSDDSMFGELRRRRISTISANFSGILRRVGDVTTFGLEADHGRADLSANMADQAADALSSNIDGRYWRLRWRLGQAFRIGSGILSLKANGQWADRNLDSTQQFALGGVSQVRAFPTAEGLGDAGWAATMEWRQPVAASVDGRLFADTGSVQRNAKPWVAQTNRYSLSDIGAGFTWRLPEKLRITTDLACQLSGNAGRNPDDTDSDGRQSRWRLWVALSREF